MMREEFDNILTKEYKYTAEDLAKITDQDYKKIEYVYTFYPRINNKLQVAWLYHNFGMIIFDDMWDRATDTEDVENSISEEERKLAELKAELDNLRGVR